MTFSVQQGARTGVLAPNFSSFFESLESYLLKLLLGKGLVDNTYFCAFHLLTHLMCWLRCMSQLRVRIYFWKGCTLATILTFWAGGRGQLAPPGTFAHYFWGLLLKIEELDSNNTSGCTSDWQQTADLIRTQYPLKTSFEADDPGSSSRTPFPCWNNRIHVY